jgi:predicted branched-subunit amino acid permease
MYVNWNLWTLAGLLFGAAVPGLDKLGLDFALAATFIAIVVPQLANLPRFGAAVAAGALAYLWRDLPYNLGLLAAVSVGVIVGMTLLRARPRRRVAQEDAA